MSIFAEPKPTKDAGHPFILMSNVDHFRPDREALGQARVSAPTLSAISYLTLSEATLHVLLFLATQWSVQAVVLAGFHAACSFSRRGFGYVTWLYPGPGYTRGRSKPGTRVYPSWLYQWSRYIR